MSQAPSNDAPHETDWPLPLSRAEMKTLMTVARDTITWCADGHNGPFLFDRYARTALLNESYATFVSLYRDGELRGCMGTIDALSALIVSVHQNAANASTRDPRFVPVLRDEMEVLDVSISVLSPLRPIAALDAFTVGQHGIMLESGHYRGVFLPEVALEQGWDRDDTFRALCRKAGAPDTLDPKTCELSVFESLSITGSGDEPEPG